MEQLVTITIVTVIMMFHRGNSMEPEKTNQKKNRLDLLRNWSGKHTEKYFFLLRSQTLNRNIKN